VTDRAKTPMADNPGSERDQGGEPKRRTFLAMLSYGLGGFAALLVGVPVVADVLKSMWLKKPREWRSVGTVDSFKVGQTVPVKFENSQPDAWAGSARQSAAYLRRQGQSEFIAFTVNCSHLGCPVRWEPKAEMFMCPCHGGVYYSDGDVAAGPPPRPLARYPVRINGKNVEIETTPLPINGRVPKPS